MKLIKIDFVLMASVLALSIAGVFFIFSTGYSASEGMTALYSENSFIEGGASFLKQIFFLIISMIIMIILYFINYRIIGQHIYKLYAMGIAALLLTLIFGKTINGAKSWLGIGPFGIQPSEFMKIIVILTLAKYVELRGREFREMRDLIVPFLIVIVPVGLILLQPDLGTSLIYIPILFSILLVGGARLDHLFFIVLTGLVAVLLPMFISYYDITEEAHYQGAMRHVVNFFKQRGVIFLYALYLFLGGLIVYAIRYFLKIKWMQYIVNFFFSLSLGLIFSLAVEVVLKEYQKRRLLVFLDPGLDPFNSGYQIIQSLIAVGSGGLTGVGFLRGTQNRLHFLPQQTSDFIFSVICEETGFIGGAFILFLFFLFIYRGVRLIMISKDIFGALIVTGYISTIVIHVMVNIGVTIGIMPLTGIPLVLISAGGSSLLANFIGIGILLNIYSNRFTY